MLKILKKEIDWKLVKNVSRTTVNKEHSEKEATEGFKKAMLKAEHSPIRLLKITFLFDKIKSYSATHFSRHSWECFIGTQRSDRTGIDRSARNQEEPVPMSGEMNAQHLIDTSRKRLCYESDSYTVKRMEDLKVALTLDSETKPIADVMVPNCVYRCGCPEISSCKFFDGFKKEAGKHNIDLSDISERYSFYNAMFMEGKESYK